MVGKCHCWTGQSAVAATANCRSASGLNSTSGGELKLYLGWKRNTCMCVHVVFFADPKLLDVKNIRRPICTQNEFLHNKSWTNKWINLNKLETPFEIHSKNYKILHTRRAVHWLHGKRWRNCSNSRSSSNKVIRIVSGHQLLTSSLMWWKSTTTVGNCSPDKVVESGLRGSNTTGLSWSYLMAWLKERKWNTYWRIGCIYHNTKFPGHRHKSSQSNYGVERRRRQNNSWCIHTERNQEQNKIAFQ